MCCSILFRLFRYNHYQPWMGKQLTALIMDYIDRVYVDLKDREPGNFLMSSLKDPEKFIVAVKFLIDGGWLVNVHWDSGYTTLFIEEKFFYDEIKKLGSEIHKSGWYDREETVENIPAP